MNVMAIRVSSFPLQCALLPHPSPSPSTSVTDGWRAFEMVSPMASPQDRSISPHFPKDVMLSLPCVIRAETDFFRTPIALEVRSSAFRLSLVRWNIL